MDTYPFRPSHFDFHPLKDSISMSMPHICSTLQASKTREEEEVCGKFTGNLCVSYTLLEIHAYRTHYWKFMRIVHSLVCVSCTVSLRVRFRMRMCAYFVPIFGTK
jgi:hypothetical protein